MSYLLSVFTGLKYLGRHFDDDPTDQLHYRVTSNTLICLAIVVSFKQFGGKPVECMMPDHLPTPWEQFAENYCWAQDTYYLSLDQDLTRSDDLRNARISYYQWVPFFLLFSALSFQIPAQVWRFLSTSSGIRLESLVEQAIDPKNIVLEARQQAIRTVATHLENALRFQYRLQKRQMVPHKVLRFLNLPYKAFFMTFIYLLVKLLYALNVLAQFLIMNYFLQTDTGSHGWYGWSTLNNIINGTQWSTSGLFPRVTLCDFYIRVPGWVQRYSIQCVLSINLFTEKIFIFLWFWYHILGVITVLSFLYWFVVCLPPWFPRWFVVRHLELADMPFDPVESDKDVRRFVNNYLRTDGVFVLRMINMHTGVIFSSEVVATLYKLHVGIEELVRSSSHHKKWPTIAQIQKTTEEKVQFSPQPPTALDQPDKASNVIFDLGDKKEPEDEDKTRFIFPTAPASASKQKEWSEDENDNEEAALDSPYSSAATRKRRTAGSENA